MTEISKNRRNIDELIAEHYRMSKKLMGEYDEAYGQIVAYLRSGSMVAEVVESCIGDVLVMLLEGQERGVSVSQVIGDDLETFCRQVEASVDNGTSKDRLMDRIRMLIPSVQVALFFAWFNNINFKNGIYDGLTILHVNLAMVVNFVLMVFCGVFLLQVFHVLLFPKKKQTKVSENIRFGGLFLAMVTFMVIVQISLRSYHLVDLHSGWIVFAIGTLWIANRLLFGPISSNRIR